jgi:DegV family protein with EDD domain
MSKNYVIFSDSGCDLPEEVIKQYKLGIVKLALKIDDNVYGEDSDTVPIKEFYDKMRAGSLTSTSQATPEQFVNAFDKTLAEGKDVLYIAFSSGLSGTYNSSMIARETLLEKYPERKVIVVDSLAASMGQGLFVYFAACLKEEGNTIEEVAEWCEKNKLNIGHMFTVDDLVYLYRGGRVSRATQIAGSILGIKPVLHVDDEGHLIAVGKVRGRKQALTALVDGMAERIGNHTENITVGISHGDCYDDLKFVMDLVSKKYKVKKFITSYVGTIIGAHSGPGTVALFFYADKR